VVDNATPYNKLSASGSDYASFFYIREGSYTVHITAQGLDRVFSFSKQFYHPGSGGLTCNYHIENPGLNSPAVFGECKTVR